VDVDDVSFDELTSRSHVVGRELFLFDDLIEMAVKALPDLVGKAKRSPRRRGTP
jgi:hypothetical protein